MGWHESGTNTFNADTTDFSTPTSSSYGSVPVGVDYSQISQPVPTAYPYVSGAFGGPRGNERFR